MAYKQPHRNVAPAKQVDTSPIKLPEPSPLMQSYNMTPNVSESEAKKVRDKFDDTYMKSEPVTKKAGSWKKTALNIAKGVGLHPAGHALVAISKHPKVKQVVQKFSEGAKDALENITKPRPELQTGGGGPIKKTDPNVSTGTGPAITPVVEKGVIPSGMTTGTDNYLNEVVVTARPKKTRAEHRLDKTQVKGEKAASKGNYDKANRLQARKQRLLSKIDRQENKDKKKYARKKNKKFWQDN